MSLPNERSDNPADFLYQLDSLSADQQEEFVAASTEDPDLSLEDWADENAIELADLDEEQTEDN